MSRNRGLAGTLLLGIKLACSSSHEEYSLSNTLRNNILDLRLLPLEKLVRKVVSDCGKKRCVSTGVRKPGNTCASTTAMI